MDKCSKEQTANRRAVVTGRSHPRQEPALKIVNDGIGYGHVHPEQVDGIIIHTPDYAYVEEEKADVLYSSNMYSSL